MNSTLHQPKSSRRPQPGNHSSQRKQFQRSKNPDTPSFPGYSQWKLREGIIVGNNWEDFCFIVIKVRRERNSTTWRFQNDHSVSVDGCRTLAIFDSWDSGILDMISFIKTHKRKSTLPSQPCFPVDGDDSVILRSVSSQSNRWFIDIFPVEESRRCTI